MILGKKRNIKVTFDYIVVGAGSAGCVVANRLSENPNIKVALIEAGGRDWRPWIHIPVGYFKTMGHPATDWCYKTQSDPGLNGRAINWPRGRGLGGSSSINGLLYVRGQAQDYDDWRQLGNIGWGWDDVLPYFKKAEHWDGQVSDIRGTGGPLHVSKNQVHRQIVESWMTSAVHAGYMWTDDYNGVQQDGFSYYQMTMKNGSRCSSAVAYLNPAKSRKNLHIITHAHMTRILLKDKRAIGVQVNIKGVDQDIFAHAEVILAAGAIGSPHSLMLSGIGDARHLGDKGVTSVHHLPGVGQNLQDHLQARPIYKCNVSTINTETRNPIKLLLMAAQYALTRKGPMAMAASLGAGFIKSHPELETPDLQYHIQPFSADTPAEGPHRFSAFTASVLQLRPHSTGHIALTSHHPLAYPAIHPQYLSETIDCDTIIQGVKITRHICTYLPVCDMITAEYAPGPDIQTDDEILNWVRDTATTIYHPTSTCKMGQDSMAVVDSQLRVRGIDSLRVADASIMPKIISGNTNAACIMIGEKLSDMVLKK